MAIRTLSTREVYRNHWMRVREDAIERNNGAHGIYGVVDKQDCAIILPIDGDHIWLVEQFRYTIGERALELPQGGWEADNIDPEALARGELREETGLIAARMTELPWMWIAYGFARQRQHIFIAEDLTLDAHQRDLEESDMEVIRLPIATFEQKLRDGEIRDVCTLAAWASYRLHRPAS
jgi:8-oxo-dGTP pyrophosphatase MutT (NUDIX family)